MLMVTRFCSETCTLDLGHRIGRTAADACRDKDSLAFAYLCESVATVDHRRGRYASAYDFFQKALEIRLRDSSTHPRVLADSYSAVGLALFGLFRSEDAIKAVDQAMALVHSAPQDEQETYNVDRYLRNRSRPKIALGRYEEAREDVAYAERFQTSVYHEDSHFHGE
jgi:tetratricopeptide (TPR) repeat protein